MSTEQCAPWNNKNVSGEIDRSPKKRMEVENASQCEPHGRISLFYIFFTLFFRNVDA